VVASRRGLLRRFRTRPRRHRPGWYIYALRAQLLDVEDLVVIAAIEEGQSSAWIHEPSCCGANSNPSRCVCAISSSEVSDAVAEGVLVSRMRRFLVQ
jgi:hypothetical protein